MATTPKWAAGVADLHFRYTYDNQLCENVYSFSYSVPGPAPNETELHALGIEWQTVCVPLMRPIYCSDVIFREFYIADMGDPHTALRANSTVSLGAVTGTHSGNSSPGNVAVNMLIRSGYRGYGYHGAKRIGPIPANEVTRNEFSLAWINLIAAFTPQMLAARVSGRFYPCIAKYKSHTYIRAASVVFNDSEVDSQKTRLTGHGR